MIRIIAIGKKHEDWVCDGIERYQKRLKAPFSVEWVFLPHSRLEGTSARLEESERIESRIKDNDYIVLLDETGTQLSSPALTTVFEQQFNGSRAITMIIGGAFGVSDRLQTRANLMWSLSPLVFPHQLVRLILIEQLYRAQEIARGSNYHHA